MSRLNIIPNIFVMMFFCFAFQLQGGSLPTEKDNTIIHKVPFASSGNTIELALANQSPQPLQQISVAAENIPLWMSMKKTTQEIKNLESGEETSAVFSFSVDKDAPVNQNYELTFKIKLSSETMVTKKVSIFVNAPQKFDLIQNYPNPFNPATTIAFQLPLQAKVRLAIYNILGQEVEALLLGNKPAGYHKVEWDGRGYASGVYFYRITAEDALGKKQIAQKRMLLLK